MPQAWQAADAAPDTWQRQVGKNVEDRLLHMQQRTNRSTVRKAVGFEKHISWTVQLLGAAFLHPTGVRLWRITAEGSYSNAGYIGHE